MNKFYVVIGFDVPYDKSGIYSQSLQIVTEESNPKEILKQVQFWAQFHGDAGYIFVYDNSGDEVAKYRKHPSDAV